MDEDRSSPDARYGSWKFIHEISSEDLKANPIWLWCFSLGLPDEEDGPIGGDETSMRPLLDSKNVEPWMSEPLILLQVKGTTQIASGLYDQNKRRIISLTIEPLSSDEHTKLSQVGGLRVPTDWVAPLIFVAVPSIDGRTDVEFLCATFDKDEAVARHIPRSAD